MYYRIILIGQLLIQLLLVLALKSQNIRGAIPVKNDELNIGSTYAIIIGLSKYKNVINLQYADRDALAFRNYLVKNLKNPQDSVNIELFLNEEAGKFRIGDAISNILQNTKSGDRVYFYFAGHGDIEDLSQTENGLLLLYDSPNGNYFAMLHDVIQVSELSNYFGKLSQKGVDVIYVIDACHSGKLKGGTSGSIHTSSAISRSFSENSTVILSCQSNQLSLESQEWGGGRGLFSFNLENGLRGAADFDKNGIITLFELERFVRDQTFIISEGNQIPVIDGDVKKVLAILNPADSNSNLDSTQVNYKSYNIVNVKGDEWAYVDDLDSISRKAYSQYKTNISKGKLIEPFSDNAIKNYHEFYERHPEHCIALVMKRNLAIYLNEKFDTLIASLLVGKKPVYTIFQCETIKKELEMCLTLINKDHYMYNSILSRKLYIDALVESIGININNYEPIMESKMNNSIQLLRQSRQLEPSASYVHYMLALTFQSMGSADSALFYFKKYLTLVPNSYAAHNVMAIAYADLGYWEESMHEFKKALELNSLYIESYVNLSYVLSYFKRYDEAISSLKKAMTINPDFVSIYNNLGSVYFEMLDYKKAIEAWKYSIKLDPHAYRTYINLGNAYYNIGNYLLAEQMLKKANDIKPGCADVTRLLGNIYMEQFRNSEASAMLEKELKVDSTNIKLLKDLGIIYKRMDSLDKAEYCFNSAFQLSKRNGHNKEILADIYHYGYGDYKQAQKLYQEAVIADTTNSHLFRKCILNLVYNGKVNEAKELFKRYKRAFPNHIELFYIEACISSKLGKYNSTFINLDKFVKSGSDAFGRIFYEPILSDFRNTSQFKKLCNKHS
jgi:tetratricopeptide (TPR) repeat protein